MNDNVNIALAKEAIAAFCKATGIKGRYAKGYFIIDQCQPRLKLKVITLDQTLGAMMNFNILNKEDDHEYIIVMRHVCLEKAKFLRQDQIPFIDTAGNGVIDKLPLFLYVEGRRPDKDNRPKPLKAFRKTGLKVIFAFLCNPGLENKTYREIAGNAGVALGAVGRIMGELEQKGFLRRKMGKNFLLVNKKELFKRWVTAYPEQLRPTIILGRYTLPNLRLCLTENKLDKENYLWDIDKLYDGSDNDIITACDHDIELAGAQLLGCDIGRIANEDTKDFLLVILNEELQGDDQWLIQAIESTYAVNYEKAFAILAHFKMGLAGI